MSHRPKSLGSRHAGGGCLGPARGRSAAPGRSSLPGRGKGRRKERDGPRPGLSPHLPQARKGPRPSKGPPSELPAGSRAALGKCAAQGGEETEGETGQEEEPRCSAAAATARPSGSRAPQAPGEEGREPSAMATARAGGEAEQPPLRCAWPQPWGRATAGSEEGRGQDTTPPAPKPGRRPAPVPYGRARLRAAGSCSLGVCTTSLLCLFWYSL